MLKLSDLTPLSDHILFRPLIGYTYSLYSHKIASVSKPEFTHKVPCARNFGVCPFCQTWHFIQDYVIPGIDRSNGSITYLRIDKSVFSSMAEKLRELGYRSSEMEYFDFEFIKNKNFVYNPLSLMQTEFSINLLNERELNADELIIKDMIDYASLDVFSNGKIFQKCIGKYFHNNQHDLLYPKRLSSPWDIGVSLPTNFSFRFVDNAGNNAGNNLAPQPQANPPQQVVWAEPMWVQAGFHIRNNNQ